MIREENEGNRRAGTPSAHGEPQRVINGLELPDNLLAAAASLFRRHGYAQTTTRELASSLGIQKGSLYHYIKTKEDLLYGLCLKSLETINEQVQQAIGPVDPRYQLPAMIDAHVRSILGQQDMHTVMLTELRALSASRQREVIARRDRYEALVRSVLSAGQEAGLVRRDIESKYLALALLNLLNWTIFWYRAGGNLSPAETASLMRTIYLDSVRPERASDAMART